MLIDKDEQMFSTNEVAEILGVGAPTVRTQISKGKLKATKIGRDNYVSQAEIDRYKAEKSPTGWKAGVPRKAE